MLLQDIRYLIQTMMVFKKEILTVTNKKLDNYDLPDTGGFGTFGYYAIGALFITATLFAIIAINKKKGAYN